MASNLYWQDDSGTFYEYEADTAKHVYGWFRNLATDESVRVKWADLKPSSIEAALAWAQGVLA